MSVERKIMFSGLLREDIARLRELCIGCETCRGLCLDLVQMAVLPGLLPSRREPRP